MEVDPNAAQNFADAMNESPPLHTQHDGSDAQTPQSWLSAQTIAVGSFSLALLAVALLILLRRRKPRGNAVLLVGAQDAGKTSILSMMLFNEPLPTHTSLQANSALVTMEELKEPVQIIDIPGHLRLRNQFREHIPSSKAVVFVADSSTISRNAPVVAEHLHQVLLALTSLQPSQPQPRLLILAHKCDLIKSSSTSSLPALAINRVQTVLERELDKRRIAESSGVGVDTLGAENEAREWGGLECRGGVFRFSEWEGGDVQFLGTSAKWQSDTEKNTVDGLASFRQWLLENL